MLAYVHCLSFILFLANIGGLMGLCLGFSLLSVVELIYFFTLRWCVLCCRRKGGGRGGIQNMVIWVVKFSRGKDTKLEDDSQNLRLINVGFPTLSSYLFGQLNEYLS
jgi:hypothetical protein